jgi:hypothetical protein
MENLLVTFAQGMMTSYPWVLVIKTMAFFLRTGSGYLALSLASIDSRKISY